MIILITGLPGNGKTLYTIWHVKELAEKEGRPVYYSGIPELAIPSWTEIDEEQARKWYELPAGAIIVIDEAQRIFRPRAGRGDPPAHVAQLETHRHNGHDLYLVTQHPALIDQNVRRLSGLHRHIQRRFGMQSATIHEWGEVHMDCERRRDDSSKTSWKYPKNVFSLYKSAQVHTHKIHLPKQVYYIFIGIALVLSIGVYFWSVYFSDKPKPEQSVSASQVPVQSQSQAQLVPQFGGNEKKPMTKDEYIASLTPRIPDFPHTAPRYDQITQPIDAPYPVGCYTIGNKCKCVSQQGTPIKTSLETCQNIVQNGYFKDWLPPAQSQPPAPRQEQQAPAQPDPAQV